MTATPVACNLRSELQLGRTLERATSKLYLGVSCEPLGGLLVPLESLFGAHGGPLGGLLGPLGSLLEASWEPLGAFWALLGASWGRLDISWLLRAN